MKKRLLHKSKILFVMGAVSLSVLCLALIIRYSDNNNRKIQPIEVEIPLALTDEAEISDFIHYSANTLNLWGTNFNELISEQEKLSTKGKKITIYQQVKLINLADKYITEHNKFQIVCDDIYEQALIHSQNLDEPKKIAINEFIEKVKNYENQVLQLCNPSNNLKDKHKLSKGSVRLNQKKSKGNSILTNPLV
jgi:hypothetical protein